MTDSRKSRENPEIRKFILQNIQTHPSAVGSLACEQFGLSRQTINRYLRRLETEGLVKGEGKTSARKYTLQLTKDYAEKLNVTADMSESAVWTKTIEPYVKDLPKNIQSICNYGFTEMFNNVIDHSQSPTAIVAYRQNPLYLEMVVTDKGVGIFEKIQKDFSLADPRSALLELSKGKLTSDKTKHSGEGVFFTSRMFNRYSILSGNLFYTRTRTGGDKTEDHGWLIEVDDRVEYTKGTIIDMQIALDADWTARDVFEIFQNEDSDFAKTHVPIMLGRYDKEQLISRSQAKRVLARFERFEEVFLDFQDVTEIGQAFADEIFRVFPLAHPDIKIVVINTNDTVASMIKHARAANPYGPSDVPSAQS